MHFGNWLCSLTDEIMEQIQKCTIKILMGGGGGGER